VNSTLRPLLTCTLLVPLLGACKSIDKVLSLDLIDLPDSRIENLERLHTPSGMHHYAVHLVGDVEYAFNRSGRTIGGVRIGKPDDSMAQEGRKNTLSDPSETCYELLGELLDFDSEDDLRLASMQVTWCARIIQTDPSPLSRERATLALGMHGRRVSIDGPRFLPIEMPRADADQTAHLLTGVVANWRGLRQGTALAGELGASLQELSSTRFDLDGARRVLPALAGLLGGAYPGEPGYAQLSEVTLEFQRRTIELALWHAYDRPESAGRVRAAAVTASVEADGVAMLARFVGTSLATERRRGADRDADLVIEILRLVALLGLPESLEEFGDEQFQEVREGWLAQLMGLAIGDPDSQVRVKAMQALTKVTDGPGTLREEDWEEWYHQRVMRQREEAGLPRALDAVDPGSDPTGEDQTP
jgi:hypothetical protein